MLIPLLKIRAKQLVRILYELGLIRTVILFVMIGVALVGMFSFLSNGADNPQLVAVGIVVVILSIHLKRNDRIFFNTYTIRPWIIYQVEYFLLSLVLLIPLLIFGYYGLATLAFTGVLAIPFINIRSFGLTFNTSLQRLIPDEMIEWKSGVRKNLIPLVLLWLVGVAGSFFIGTVPMVIFIIGAIVAGFYEKFEPVQVVQASEHGGSQFIHRKLRMHLLLFISVLAPLIISFIFFHPQQYYIPLVELVLLCILVAFSILMKYAFYQPEKDAGVSQTLLSIGYLGIFLPFFLPVVIVFLFKYYFRAKRNLNTYLHDLDQ